MSTIRQQHSLCGDWSWAADPGDSGQDKKWNTGLPEDAHPITAPVPGTYPHATTRVWAATTFTCESGWRDRQVELHFDALPSKTEVWLNGKRIGDTAPTWEPASFVLNPALQDGENLLVLRLITADDALPLIGGATLKVVPRNHIESVAIFPDLRRQRIALRVDLPASASLRFQIDGTRCTVEGTGPEHTLDFPNFETWSPENPRRYTLRAELLDGDTVIDQLDTEFAMREFSIKDNRFHLNNHPFFVKGIWHRPNRSALHGAEGSERAKREIQAVLDAGFNLLRICDHAAPPALLDAADAAGVLLVQPAQNADIVARDLNRPSLIAWDMDNPSMDPDSLRVSDPGRTIFQRNTDGSARYFRPYREESDAYCDLRIPLTAPVSPASERALRNCGSEKQLTFLSQFGFGTFDGTDLDVLEPGFSARQLERVFGNREKFVEDALLPPCDAARLQIDAARSNPKLAGYCFAQLHDDGPVPGAGILDRNNKPKPGLAALNKIQLPTRPLIQMPQSNLLPRQEARVRILLANEDRLEGRAELSLQVVGPTNQVLWKKKRGVNLVKHGKPVWEGEIAASGSPGMHRFIVRLLQPGKVLAESSMSFLVLNPVERTQQTVNLLDPHGQWSKRCKAFIRPESITAPLHIVPPLGDSFRAYPDNELMQILAQVHGGGVAIFFEPPADWNELAEQVSDDIKATPVPADNWDTVLHYARIHPILEGFPVKSLMRQPYKNIVPPVVFAETSEENIAGALVWRGEDAPTPATWGSSVLVRRYGSGLVVFTHMRLLNYLGADVGADRVFENMVAHFSRRSLPSATPIPVTKSAVEWLRRERNNNARRWMILGALPNVDGAGHARAYPPEQQVDLKQQLPGWQAPAEWRPGYAVATGQDTFRLSPDRAISLATGDRLQDCSRTIYAYAEFNAEFRQEIELTLNTTAASKIWLNGKMVFEQEKDGDPDGIPMYMRQSRNTLLIKLSQERGPLDFSYSFVSAQGSLAPILWWR